MTLPHPPSDRPGDQDGRGAARACSFVPAYQSRCGAPADGAGLCEKHRGIRCGVCGGQAVTECSHTGQFVCGTPLCDACEGFTDDARLNGSWGFANHTHRRKSPVCEPIPTPTGEDGAVPHLTDGGRR